MVFTSFTITTLTKQQQEEQGYLKWHGALGKKNRYSKTTEKRIQTVKKIARDLFLSEMFNSYLKRERNKYKGNAGMSGTLPFFGGFSLSWGECALLKLTKEYEFLKKER